jgi:hypothetical protein
LPAFVSENDSRFEPALAQIAPVERVGEKATRLGEWLFKNMTHVKHRAVL